MNAVRDAAWFLDWHRRMIESAASAVDRAMVAAMHVHSARDRASAQRLSHTERMATLAEVDAAYGSPSLIDDPSLFFPELPKPETDASGAATAPAFAVRQVRSKTHDLTWPSAFTPYFEPVAERYLARVENRTARARVFLEEAPEASTKRPAIVAIHGYLGGHWVFEEAQWPIPWMARRGLDVALPLLPFHGLRGGPSRGAPPFPSADPRLTNEGFRQAVTDILSLVRWLRARGAPQVGVMGMSLGGFTASLLATVSNEIDFVVPMIPLASIADFAREQGHLGSGSDATEQHAALEKANWVASPLARKLRLPKERALVIAAAHDQITPIAHAERLARHFDCEMKTVGGGHLVQIGRGDAFRALAAMLVREGIIAERQGR